MANSLQAKKRIRQSEKHRLANASYRSMTRTYVKKVLKAIQDNNRSAAQEALKKAQGVLDRAANKGLLHKKKASRLVSRLNVRIKNLAA